MESSHPLDAIVRKNASRFINMAMRVVHNHEDAEDVVQQAYLQAFRKFSQFQGRSALSTWVGSIVIRAAYMHVRRKPKVFFVSLDDKLPGVNVALSEILSAPQPLVERIISEQQNERQKRKVVCRMVASLTPLKQKLIHLRFEKEMTCKQLAATLGITFPAAKARIHRTIDDLRNQAKSDRV